VHSNEHYFYLNLVCGTCLLMFSVTRYEFIPRVANDGLGRKTKYLTCLTKSIV